MILNVHDSYGDGIIDPGYIQVSYAGKFMLQKTRSEPWRDIITDKFGCTPTKEPMASPSLVPSSVPSVEPTASLSLVPSSVPSVGEECTNKHKVRLIVTVKTDNRVKTDQTQWKIQQNSKQLGSGKLWKHENNGANQKIEIFNQCVHKWKCYTISLWEKNKTKEWNHGLKKGFVEVTFDGTFCALYALL